MISTTRLPLDSLYKYATQSLTYMFKTCGLGVKNAKLTTYFSPIYLLFMTKTSLMWFNVCGKRSDDGALSNQWMIAQINFSIIWKNKCAIHFSIWNEISKVFKLRRRLHINWYLITYLMKRFIGEDRWKGLANGYVICKWMKSVFYFY